MSRKVFVHLEVKPAEFGQLELANRKNKAVFIVLVRSEMQTWPMKTTRRRVTAPLSPPREASGTETCPFTLFGQFDQCLIQRIMLHLLSICDLKRSQTFLKTVESDLLTPFLIIIIITKMLWRRES